MRYEKQRAVKSFGEKTQQALSASTIAIVGCGALGSLQSMLLSRMGVGALRIADGDRVTLSNIHRQLLFSEKDVVENQFKVNAARRELARCNSEVGVTTMAKFITPENIQEFIRGAAVVLDATDDIQTRYLINDSCLQAGIPWIYTGVAGTGGLIMTVLPGEGACLRCLYPEPPEHGSSANCLTCGILPTTVAMAVPLQITQALKILTGEAEAGTLIQFDTIEPQLRKLKVHALSGCLCSVKSRPEGR
ncbi:MAG: HesA/MoeB/ThiF family protein [Kiritimatiellia bacterium]